MILAVAGMVGNDEEARMIEEELRTINIEAELHHKLKMRAAETKKTIKELVEVALRLYLDGGPSVSQG